MKYEYVFAAEVRGLMGGTDDIIKVINIPDAQATITYSNNRNLIPEDIDLRAALGTQMLGRLVGKAAADHELMHMVRATRQRRQTEAQTEMLVLLKITGDIEDFELQHFREETGYIFSLGESPTKYIKKLHQNCVQSLLIALNLTSTTPVWTRNLIESVLFYRNDGKPIFCYELEGRATAFTASPFNQIMAEETSATTERLLRQSSLKTVFRLLRQSMDLNSDNLLSFLSAWTALEILVRKIISEYADSTPNEPMTKQSSTNNQAAGEKPAATPSKFTLTNQFAAISRTLCMPDAEEDMKTFTSAKKTRDKFVHGEDVQIKLLPSESTRNLVSKYLRLHLRQPLNTAASALLPPAS